MSFPEGRLQASLAHLLISPPKSMPVKDMTSGQIGGLWVSYSTNASITRYVLIESYSSDALTQSSDHLKVAQKDLLVNRSRLLHPNIP